MKTLLIVEDEKLIRQGICTMVRRSGVPIELILECSNGEDALNILNSRKIDVMFTDIRMQKMDGVELVKHAFKLPDPPLMVAISGYDDFTYAVEMLRNGVREYLLKPVEREKITAVLKKLDDEINAKAHELKQEKEISIVQLKKLLSDDITKEERELIIKRYENLFPEGDYVVFCYPENAIDDETEELKIRKLPYGDISVVASEKAGSFLKNELSETVAGVSLSHNGLKELDIAYREAAEARQFSFLLGQNFDAGTERVKTVPSALKEKARDLLSEESRTKRIQILGTDKTEEVILRWRNLTKTAATLQLSYDELSEELTASLMGIPLVYRENLTPEDLDTIENLTHPLLEPDVETYESKLTDWILDLNSRLLSRPDDNGIKSKIEKAEQYIRENYQSDLNMAVVSNYVSMNYSLFSYSFKQYTGSNFVNYLKDIRVKEAMKLLKETDMKIIEISKVVGYDNDKHFMKTFKAICGVSPGEYRKNVTG